MKKLELDFQRRPAPSPAGWLVLAAGIATCGALGYVQWEQAQQQHAQAVRIARLPAPAADAARANADDPAVVAARQVLDRARLPWNALFTALAAVEGPDIALLAVTPDATRRQVKIHAEARDLNAMLAFQRELQQHPAVTQVVLIDHTVMKDLPFQPVRFHVLAQWGGARVLP